MTLPILKAMRPDPAAPPVVLDLEAYGFGRHSYPIEVGYALPDGRVFCTFIRPEPDWTHWVDAAACLHQLPCPALLSRDRPAREVATLLNEQLCGFTVYTEGWNHDYTWLSLLFDAVDQEPRLRLGNLRAMLGEQRAERWQEVKQQVARESGCQRHRASSDARLLQLTLQWVRQDLQPPPRAPAVASILGSSLPEAGSSGIGRSILFRRSKQSPANGRPHYCLRRPDRKHRPVRSAGQCQGRRSDHPHHALDWQARPDPRRTRDQVPG